jgi:hypothetical protein
MTAQGGFAMPLPTFNYAVAVVPDDAVNFVPPDGWPDGICQSLYVGTAGTVRVVFRDGKTCDYTAVSGGTLFVSAKRVNSAGTSASGIVAQYFV